MKLKLFFAAFFLLGLACASSSAQDTLYYRNGSKQFVKVLEVGLDDIKYRDFNNPDAPVFVVPKNELRKLAFSDGNFLRFEDDPLDLTPDPVAIKKTRSIKIEFFSPLTNDVAFSFEHLIKKGIALEHKIGIIGVGVGTDREDAGGVFVKSGVKFMNSPDYYSRGLKRSHPLRGGYIKPEIIFSRYTVRETEYSWNGAATNFTSHYTDYAINIVFGKQKILSEVMTLDYYVGFGYGGQDVSTDKPDNSNIFLDFSETWRPYAFSHSYMGKTFPMTISAGLTLGVLF